MAFRTLEVADQGWIRHITINRPDKLNALNRETVTELHVAFDAAKQDPGVRVIVLKGAGPKAFVAGADISELNRLSPVQALEFSRYGQQMMLNVERLGKPVLCQIQGFALGGGMELAMCCTMRIASENAKFGQPEINLGVLPGFGGTQRLLRLVGRGATLELCLLGHTIGAQRAFELGVVNRVVSADALEAEVEKIAQQLAGSAPHAVRGILDAVLIGGEAPLDVALEFESQAFAVCTSTADMREGTAAFLEKRKAVFSGA